MSRSYFNGFQWIHLSAILMLSVAIVLPGAQAQTFSVLHTYTGTPDGSQPFQSSLLSIHGDFYGVTLTGGLYNWGTVFKLDGSGHQTVLYNFTGGTDGGSPNTNLLRDAAGNLYGSTSNGGDLSCTVSSAAGCGVVFKLDPTGKETALYAFRGGSDGSYPQGIAIDSVGSIYGGTYYGGDPGCQCGVVYKVNPRTHQEAVLYTFTGGAGGGYPNGFVTLDAAGNVYGGTIGGGNLADCSGAGCGVLFKVDSTGKETALYTFTGGADGALPNASFLMDAQGNLFGTTILGGDLNCTYETYDPGCGVVFELTQSGKLKVLFTFHGTDGANPNYGLIRDAKGNFYSTTSYGGTYGYGTVFKLTREGAETVLYSFTNGSDGGVPFSGLTMDSKHNIYSNTYVGGDLSCNSPNGCGTVFKIAP